MGQYLNIGNAGFASAVKRDYVDKTGMIQYINRTIGTKKKLTCVSRPRRFGKSFAAQMLCAYYDRTCDSRSLFEGLTISKSPDFECYLNKYNVIYLDMTAFLTGNLEERRNVLVRMQTSVLKELHVSYPEIIPAEETLPEVLYAIAEGTGEKFIIIIDEWDALFREMKEERQLLDEYIRLLRALFKNSGKTDRMIEAVYMTGILPIKKYGTQSAMTDFQEYTMLRPGPLKEYVGFTEAETRVLFENSELDFEEAKKWYDGYKFGKSTHIYNPKSVMDALLFEEFGNYWTQSETYEALRLYIDMDLEGLKEDILQMLGGANLALDVDTFQNDLVSIQSKDDVLTLLVHLGYLAYDGETGTVSIPNLEVRKEFVRAVKNGKRKETAKLIANSEHLLSDTLSMNEEAVAMAIEQAHSAGTAPLFYNNEQALRSVIRFAYISCMDGYQEIQELPSGKGYADIVFIPKKNNPNPPMLIELKWNKTESTAITQIKKQNYPQILQGLSDSVLLVGINYDEETKKHTCKIDKFYFS